MPPRIKTPDRPRPAGLAGHAPVPYTLQTSERNARLLCGDLEAAQRLIVDAAVVIEVQACECDVIDSDHHLHLDCQLLDFLSKGIDFLSFFVFHGLDLLLVALNHAAFLFLVDLIALFLDLFHQLFAHFLFQELRRVLHVDFKAEQSEGLDSASSLVTQPLSGAGRRAWMSSPGRGEGLRPPQQGPGKILDRLQLMMSETGKTELASFEFAKFSGRGESVAAGSHLDPGISYGTVDVSDRPRRGIRQRLAIVSGGRGEFCIEIALHKDLEAEAF